MAAGDVVQFGPTSIANNGFLDLQPGAGVEVVVHNIYVPENTAVEFYFYDGTNSILFDSDAVAPSRFSHAFHVTNSKYVRVKNVSGSSVFLAADGVQTG